MPHRLPDFEELRPIVHQHVAMLTAAGQRPATALAIATMTVALVYSDEFDVAMAEAMKAVSNNE